MRNKVAIVAISVLAGCGSPLISAEPLVVAPADLTAAVNGGSKKEFLGQLVFQSEQKCTAFLNSLVASMAGINSVGDITAGALSGIAAFTTPVATSHILSGTASIVTGAKASLDSDFYAKASIANFESAIQQSYFANIGKYASALEDQDDAKLTIAIELGKIQSYHASCGIGPAEAAIAATVAPPGPAAGGGSGAPGGPGVPAPALAAPPPPLAPPLAVLPPVGAGVSQTPYMTPGGRLH